jgi:hypothetical protein
MKKRPNRLPAIVVSIAPYGRLKIDGEPAALAFLKSNWADLWPNVKRDLKAMVKEIQRDFDPPVRPKACKWTAYSGQLPPDVFMGDKADLFLGIQLAETPPPEDDLPRWDFFIKGTEIMHCQPVW